MIFTTTSGSIYEINYEHNVFRKLNGDGIWHEYANVVSDVAVGHSFQALLRELDENGLARSFHTTPVVSVSEGLN